MGKYSDSIFLEIYGDQDLKLATQPRKGEQKLGEKFSFPSSKELSDLEKETARFVLVGIGEDIGVQGNYGRKGAREGWDVAFPALCNMQSNKYLSGEEILILGKVNAEKAMDSIAELDPSIEAQAREIHLAVQALDDFISGLCAEIIKAGKTPIFIGGGHNNAYPLLKGSSQAFETEDGVNVFNCDPHADFRKIEGRHSGNGFRYAHEEGFLNRYFLMGFHESYNNQASLDALAKMEEDWKRVSFDSMYVRNETTLEYQLERAVIFLRKKPTGLEIDLDSIENMPSSAMGPSGFTPNQVRRMIYKLGYSAHCAYLHIAEGAPKYSNDQGKMLGKFMAYLITDFVKAQNKKASE